VSVGQKIMLVLAVPFFVVAFFLSTTQVRVEGFNCGTAFKAHQDAAELSVDVVVKDAHLEPVDCQRPLRDRRGIAGAFALVSVILVGVVLSTRPTGDRHWRDRQREEREFFQTLQ
jgi:hypothetical protein